MHDRRDDPAFPATYSSHRPGITLRQLAALILRVTDSGTAWMDEMIAKASDARSADDATAVAERQEPVGVVAVTPISEISFRWHRIHTPDEQEIFYLSRLPSIRTVARTLGYAIGVHGSMRRDLDLIAVPWVEKHSTPDALAKAIQYAACGMHGDVVTWQQKPCGRIATSLPICWTEDNRPSSGHIDLSVMVSNVEAAADRRRDEGPH